MFITFQIFNNDLILAHKMALKDMEEVSGIKRKKTKN